MPIDILKADFVGATEEKTKIVLKDWGQEYILPGEGYTTKLMEIKPGYKCSLHFHRIKNETFVLVQGSLIVEFFLPDSTSVVHHLTRPMSAVILPACTPHTFSIPKEQKENTIFIESSTLDDPKDSYRLTKSGPI